jgi:RES domain-containing protein
MIHDIEIVDILDSMQPDEYSGSIWRTTWQGRSPLLGGTGGGRWSPSSGFETLYTSFDKDTSISELHYHLSQAPVFSSSNVEIWELRIDKLQILNLSTNSALKDLRIDARNHGKEQLEHCQKIGAAAYFLGHQGILVPSYRASGTNCVIFSERLDLDQLHERFAQPINWPAWIKARKND